MTDQELYKRVDEILHYMWDPIGIEGSPHARDEYASYVAEVVRLLNNGASDTDIADHLNGLVTGAMGMQGDREHDKNIAALLLDTKDFLAQA